MARADDESKSVEAPIDPPEETAQRDGKPGSALRPMGLTRPLALIASALVLFPFLAKSGIWDPYELNAADLARRIAVNAFHATGLSLPNANNALPTLSDLKMGELPFTSM